MGWSSAISRVAAAVLALACLSAPSAGRAQGLSAYLEGNFQTNDVDAVDATGRESRSTGWSAIQRYRLSFDERPYPLLGLNGMANLEWVPGETTTGGQTLASNARQWNVYIQAPVGPPILNVSPFFTTRRQIDAGPTLGSTVVGANLAWVPPDWPRLSLRYTHQDDFDEARVLVSRLTDEVQLSLTYDQLAGWNLSYSFRFDDIRDDIVLTNTTDIVNSLQVNWAGAFLRGRLLTNASYSASHRMTAITGQPGTVLLQQFPASGISLVESFPAVPSKDTLVANPALIDGDVRSSAGINIGFRPSQGGDQDFRDLGVGFSDATTPVDMVYLWVDKDLPPLVAVAYSFTAWRSDDNVDWVPVPLAGPVVFGQLNARFEIPIARTQARYVKVVTRPLPVGTTLDPRFQDVFVTELQVYSAASTADEALRSQTFGGTLAASLRYGILQSPVLSYDLSGQLSQSGGFAPRSWMVTNGLNYQQPISPQLRVTGRAERTDSNGGSGHESSTRLNATLAYDPIPAFGASISWSGSLSETLDDRILATSSTLVARANLYRGVSLYGTASVGLAHHASGLENFSSSVTGGLTVAPAPIVTFNGSAGWSRSVDQGPVAVTVPLSRTILQASATFNPVAAVYVSAGATRSSGDGTSGPSTLGNLALGFSPFPDGQLLLSFNYTDTIASATETRTRIIGPALRWKMRWNATLDASYTWLDNLQPSGSTYTRSLAITLTILLN